MGRWLPKEEREKRDKKIIELYQQGVSYQAIFLRFGVNVNDLLKRRGMEFNRRSNNGTAK